MLKPMLVLNADNELPIFLNYDNLFEVCFYYGRNVEDLEVCWFFVNKMSEYESNVLPSGVKDDCFTLADLEGDLILCIP